MKNEERIVELLTEMVQKQDQHTAILQQHATILQQHSTSLQQHSALLTEQSSLLTKHSEILVDLLAENRETRR
ncbi:MAG: hypothetical protein H7Z75_06410 [Ferruginibacter sp.]|nr:hypothetical protein [Cytophagales bacterium]